MIERYIWLAFVAVATIFVLSVRSELAIRGSRSAAVALGIVNLPWLLIGFGMLVDPRPNDYFRLFSLRAGWIGPALIASVIANWVAAAWWVFAANGAERLADAPRVRSTLRLPREADTIKLFTIAGIGGGVLGLVGIVIAQN
jgi:hypothetical protein